MEHRYSHRVSLNINTLIYKRGTPVAMGRIKNGSDQGLYLETDYQGVRELQKLELEVLLGRRIKGKQRCQVSALVVRKSPFGYGLQLNMREDSSSEALRNYIEQQQVAQHPQSPHVIADTPAQVVAQGGYKKGEPSLSPRG